MKSSSYNLMRYLLLKEDIIQELLCKMVVGRKMVRTPVKDYSIIVEEFIFIKLKIVGL